MGHEVHNECVQSKPTLTGTKCVVGTSVLRTLKTAYTAAETLLHFQQVCECVKQHVLCQPHFSNSDTRQRKNADMPSIDFAGAEVIFKPKCIPGTATVASNRSERGEWTFSAEASR